MLWGYLIASLRTEARSETEILCYDLTALMLGLLRPTPIEWIQTALADFNAVLLDHFYCELKAASNAMALVARYPMHEKLVAQLTALAQEELTHVQQVHQELKSRGIVPKPPPEDTYAVALRRAASDRSSQPLLDRLMVGAMIEARSCERFSLLKQHAPTPELQQWYSDLFASEARHYRLFYSLAEEIFGETLTKERFTKLAVAEAEIVSQLPVVPKIH